MIWAELRHSETIMTKYLAPSAFQGLKLSHFSGEIPLGPYLFDASKKVLNFSISEAEDGSRGLFFFFFILTQLPTQI